MRSITSVQSLTPLYCLDLVGAAKLFSSIRWVDAPDGCFSIFTHPVRPAGKEQKWYLSDAELSASNIYVLLNCQEIEPFVEIFEEEVKKSSHEVWKNGCLIKGEKVEMKLLTLGASSPHFSPLNWSRTEG